MSIMTENYIYWIAPVLLAFIVIYFFRAGSIRKKNCHDEDLFDIIMNNAMINDTVNGKDRWICAVEESIRQLRLKSRQSEDHVERRKLAKDLITLEQLAEKMRFR